jgi:asparagine synthase (glutamine-hydrolysing)
LFMGRINYLADLLIRARLWSLYQELRGVYPYDFSTGKRTSAKKIALAYMYAPLEPAWLTTLRKRRVQRSYPQPWILPSLARRTGLLDRWPRGEGPSFPTVYTQDCYDVFHYELLTAVEYHDAVSAPFGIETRFPLLDLRLVEHLFALPRHWKLNRGRSRILQKRAMAGILPDKVLRDHLKKDFHPTLERFLVREYQKLVPAMLDSGRQRSAEFIDWSVIRQKYDACMNKQEKSTPLWFALNLERWLCREF